MVAITIRDELAGGDVPVEHELTLPAERMTVRELIRERVFQEVKDRNAGRQLKRRMLVTPTEEETRLNGPDMGRARPIDWQKQFDIACRAFQNNTILVLIDDRQADALDDQFDVSTQTTVTFLQLEMLAGG